MSSAFSFDFLEPTLEFQTTVTFLLVDKNKVRAFIFLVRSQGKFGKNCRDLLKFSLFYSCSYCFSFGRHCTLCNVIINVISFSAKNLSRLKLYIIKSQFKIFGMNMPFISSYEARKGISFGALPLNKYAFFASPNEINGIFIPKI